MGKAGIFLMFFGLLLHISSGEDVGQLLPDTLTDCGQTIVSYNGTIQYKLGEPYDAGELCVFIVRFETGPMISHFTLEDHGLSDLEEKAIVLIPLGSFEQYYYLGPWVETVTLTAHGFIIIFKTEGSTGTGFQLSYNSEDYPGGDSQHKGTDMVFNDNPASPLKTSFSLEDMEHVNIATFVFTQRAKFITEPGSFLRVQLTVDGDIGNENGYGCVNGFHFTSFEDDMKFEKSICGSNEEYEISTRGLIIVQQVQFGHLPSNATGILNWEKSSNISSQDENARRLVGW